MNHYSILKTITTGIFVAFSSTISGQEQPSKIETTPAVKALIERKIEVNKAVFENQYYENIGGGQFSDESISSNLNVAVEAMGIAIGDYDNDLLSDIYITNINGNLLMHNKGDGTFVDTASSTNVLCNKVCWSTHFFDYDNDQDLDLHACATYTILAGNTNCMYENTGNGSFVDAYNIFLDFDSTTSYSTALGDLNNDGYLEMAVSNTTPDSVQFWMNSGGTNNWLKIMLQGTSSNSMGLGSWIDLYYDNQHFSHYPISGTGFLSQNALYSHFGLDTSSLVDSIIVAWPCGHIDKIYNISANQTINIIEGNTDAIDVSIIAANNGQLCQNDSVKIYTKGKFNNYIWSTGDTTQSIYISQSGSYQVTVTDWNNNVSTDSFTITLVNQQSINAQLTPPSCAGNSDGAINITSTGNINLFQFNWSNGSFSPSIGQLSSGIYHLTISDNNGCTDSISYTLLDPVPISTNATLNHIACFGDSTGGIDLAVSGGYPPYQYNWSNAQTGSSINGLVFGQYNVLITDSLSCILMESFILNSPLTPLVADLQSDTICTNDSTGSIQCNVSGGDPPYSFLWSNNDTLSTLQNLSAGIYQLTITDLNSCDLIVTSTINTFDSINVNFLVSSDSGNGGSIQILSDPMDSLMFLWNNGSTDSILSGLVADDYSVSITDLNQCQESFTINIPLVLSSVQSEKDGLNFRIYPNPCKDLMTLDLKELPEEYYLIEIFDLQGRMIEQIETEGSKRIKYDINVLSNGLYNLRLIGKNFVGCRQFIKSE